MNPMDNLYNYQEQNNQISFPNDQKPNSESKIYIFSKKVLKNVDSILYMNATLQWLLHVSELIVYFIDEYPKE